MGAIEGVRLIDLPVHADGRGLLSVAELGEALPFSAARIFVVWDVPWGVGRGNHAHRTCAEFIICAVGRVRVVADDGVSVTEAVLDRPDRGIYVGPMVWSQQVEHAPGTVLVVAASHPFDPAGYFKDRRAWHAALDDQ